MSESIRYQASEDTPAVVLDRENEIILFSGRSLPENVNEFYEPILEWFQEYKKNPLDHTVVNFRMEYFSTATSKVLYDLLYELEALYEKGHRVFIKWLYPFDDEDILHAGKEFDEMLELPFEFIAYDEEDEEPFQGNPYPQKKTD